MKRSMVFAAGVVALLSATQANSWSSTFTPASLNTHGCLDKVAYAFLERDRAFEGSNFPPLAALEAHEGADYQENGPGPDAKGQSSYSHHWFNPRTGQGYAPLDTAKNFLPLAYGKPGREKGAAWSAHFLADAHVPYHLNGEDVTVLREQVEANPGHVILDENITGDRALFGRPNDASLVAAGLPPPHNTDFTVEANRFLAAADANDALDWFDPWFWDGVSNLAPSLTSGHVVWEAKAVTDCPTAIGQYSPLWSGNPQTQLGDPTFAINQAVLTFVRKMAKNAWDSAADQVASPRTGEILAAESIATLWRASFSALRTNAMVSYDAATLSDPKVVPIADLRGNLGNLAVETATQIQMRARVVSGGCTLQPDTPEVQSVDSLPTSTINFGHWKVQVPRPGTCRVIVEAVGRFERTPDLQLTWKNLYLTAPALTARPPGQCSCRPGDTMCLTLCRHDAGQ